MSSEYYLYCVILKNCPYSEAAHTFLNSYNNIKKEFTFINQNEKENYKTKKINTFPQIYLKKYNSNGTQLIGGYTEIKNFFNEFYGKYNNDIITKFLSNNNLWSKKTTLRLVELINS
jgi:glutaredoxin